LAAHADALENEAAGGVDDADRRGAGEVGVKRFGMERFQPAVVEQKGQDVPVLRVVP